MKWALIVSLIATTALAGENKLMIGVSFNVSEAGSINLSTMKPWVQMDFKKAEPNNVNKFRPVEGHHGYMGIVMIGAGYLLNSKPLRVVGEVLFIDDVIQHALRIKTPVHMISDKLWQYNWYRKVLK